MMHGRLVKCGIAWSSRYAAFARGKRGILMFREIHEISTLYRLSCCQRRRNSEREFRADNKHTTGHLIYPQVFMNVTIAVWIGRSLFKDLIFKMQSNDKAGKEKD